MSEGVKLELAATVALLSEQGGKLRVFMVRRPARSSFMPSIDVFPGGRLDDEDLPVTDQLVRTYFQGAEAWPDPPKFRMAAWRELAEEAGVFLLAGDAAAPASSQLAEWRHEAMESGEGWVEAWMRRTGLVPDLAALAPFARWVTPTTEHRRFDTFFHLAALPEAQRPSSDEVETERGRWVDLSLWRDDMREGRLALSPPTFCALHVLSNHDSLESAQVEPLLGSTLEPLEPSMMRSGGSLSVALPWEDSPATEAASTPRPQGKNPFPGSRLELSQDGWRFR